jgi:hypothetical protein
MKSNARLLFGSMLALASAGAASAASPLPFTQDAGVLTVAVPTFTMHTGIVLEY